MRRRRSERGAAVVELGILILPLCLILFGLVEYGFVYKASMSTSNATRAGARTGAAEPKATSFYSDIIEAVNDSGSSTNYQNGDKLCIYEVSTAVNTNGDINVNSCGLLTGGALVCLYRRARGSANQERAPEIYRGRGRQLLAMPASAMSPLIALE